jgi:hypothetical protein
MFLLLCMQAVAGRWDGMNGDIVAKRTIPATSEQLFSYLQDLEKVAALYPDDCVGQWETGSQSTGFGASASVRYDMAMLHRKLTLTVEDGREGSFLDYDHPGKKGFQTRFLFEPGAGGTQVTMTTPLNPPPWPLTGYFFRSIKPEWEGCQARFLERLNEAFEQKSSE